MPSKYRVHLYSVAQAAYRKSYLNSLNGTELWCQDILSSRVASSLLLIMINTFFDK